MKFSPLQMAYYNLADISLTPRLGIDFEKESWALMEELGVFLEMNEEPSSDDDEDDISTWHVTLGLSFTAPEDDHSPYNFEIVLLGTFKCNKELPSGLEAERLVGINGSSMLYGIARELLLTLSEKSFWGGLTLPTMSFANYRDLLTTEETADSKSNELAR